MNLEAAKASGWGLFPGLVLGEQSMIDVISIVNDNADYMIEVMTVRENDGSILWVVRGSVDKYTFVSRENVLDDIQRAVEVLDELDQEAEAEYWAENPERIGR